MSAQVTHSWSQTTEAKKEEYRKYLEKSGVIDQLTRVLVGLYEEPERPPNATEWVRSWNSFIKKYLGAPSDTDVDHLKTQNEQLTMRVKEL